MTRNAYFRSPFLLGFDHLEKLVEQSARSAGDGYPPYNIEATEGGLCIAVAVAGFRRDELGITLLDNQLTIRGRQSDTGSHNFVHRGIAARAFERAFVLADGLEVLGATLEHGMLRIDIARRKVETAPRHIEIKSDGSGL